MVAVRASNAQTTLSGRVVECSERPESPVAEFGVVTFPSGDTEQAARSKVDERTRSHVLFPIGSASLEAWAIRVLAAGTFGGGKVRPGVA